MSINSVVSSLIITRLRVAVLAGKYISLVYFNELVLYEFDEDEFFFLFSWLMSVFFVTENSKNIDALLSILLNCCFHRENNVVYFFLISKCALCLTHTYIWKN